MISPMDSLTMVLLVIVSSLILMGMIAALAIRISEFNKERRYLNREIGRTEGAERCYWRQEKRRLWLSLLPFYRR